MNPNTPTLFSYLALVAIFLFGVAGLLIVYLKMKEGFGPFNLKVLGMMLALCMLSVFSLLTPESSNAFYGIMGTFLGYLFGIKQATKSETE